MPDTSKGTLLTAKAEDPATPQPENKPENTDNTFAPIPVATAFLVIIGADGKIGVDQDINKPYVPARTPHDDEMLGVFHALIDKLVTNKTVNMAASTILSNLPTALDQYGQQKQAEMQDAAARAQVQQMLNQQGRQGG